MSVLVSHTSAGGIRVRWWSNRSHRKQCSIMLAGSCLGPTERLVCSKGVSVGPALQGCSQRLRSKYPRHITRAAEDSENSKKGGLDWDSAWSNFKEGLNKNIPAVEDRTARPAEPQKRTSSKSPQFAKDSRRQLRENIKKQEDVVLDFWSQEVFFKAGGVFIAALIIIFLVVGGPGR